MQTFLTSIKVNFVKVPGTNIDQQQFLRPKSIVLLDHNLIYDHCILAVIISRVPRDDNEARSYERSNVLTDCLDKRSNLKITLSQALFPDYRAHWLQSKLPLSSRIRSRRQSNLCYVSSLNLYICSTYGFPCSIHVFVDEFKLPYAVYTCGFEISKCDVILRFFPSPVPLIIFFLSDSINLTALIILD